MIKFTLETKEEMCDRGVAAQQRLQGALECVFVCLRLTERVRDQMQECSTC